MKPPHHLAGTPAHTSRPGGAALPAWIDEAERAISKLAAEGALPLPPFPAVALRVQTLVARRSFGLREVARVISSDPALTADVLRCANSALHARGDPVRDLSQAITRVGADEITRITLGSALAGLALQQGGLAPLKRAIWLEGLASAVICQELGRLRRLGAGGGAFVAGLLHDFGRVVAAARLEAILASEPAVHGLPLEAWAAVVERLHVPVGVTLAYHWKLPVTIRQAVALHHGQTSQGCESPDLLEVVRISDRVVELLSSGPAVAAAQLARVPGLRGPEERETVARLVEKLPSFVAAFEGSRREDVLPQHWVRVGHRTLLPGERAVGLEVSIVAGRRTLPYRAVVLAPNGLLLLGREPVAVNSLVQAVIEGAGVPFRIWAVPRLCSRRRAFYRVELQAFALDGEARGRWNLLYRQTPAGPAAPPPSRSP